MDDRPNDALIRSTGHRANRRSLLKGLTGTGMAGLAAMGLARRPDRLAAQDATPEASPVAEEQHPAFLFVQLAESGTWIPKPGEDGVYLLTLTAPGAQTLYFSDRPERIVGTTETDQFLDALGFTPFDPPNAAAVVQTPDGTRDVLVVELFNPVYSRNFAADGADMLTYEARVLQAYEGEGLAPWVGQPDDDLLPQEFSNVSLFIDDCPDISGCYIPSMAGPISYLGPIPGGPYGQCYTFPMCSPCKTVHPCTYDWLCNNTYMGCKGACTTTQGSLWPCPPPRS